MHRLLALLHEAAAGRFPPVDGGISVVPPYANGIAAVVAFTGHAVIAAAVSKADAEARGADGFGGVYHPRMLAWLAGEMGTIGVIDATLVGRGRGGPPRLKERHDLNGHARVRLARRVREAVQVLGDERGLVTLATGLAGRLELSVEAAPEGQGKGWGRALVTDALHAIPEGVPVFAAVSPGNARSLRMFLALGFVPVASEVVILTDEADPDFR